MSELLTLLSRAELNREKGKLKDVVDFLTSRRVFMR